MGLIVQKYGGTSVGSPARIKNIADRISRKRDEGNQLVVVVSAMGDTTDELIGLARNVSKNPSHREMDMLLTAGERISMALLSMALADRGVPAISFTGSQTGIITDGSHRSARIKKILGDRVRKAIAEKKVAIVAGFQGVSETKEITTLGRGGSDTTAVALASALGAESCEIYTDVDGVFSADPRVVAVAKLWPCVSHDVMVEMATRGAGVLHPRSVELAKQYDVPLIVLNSLSEKLGTKVVSMKGMEEFNVTGVTADKGKILVTVELMRPTVLSALFQCSSESHLTIVSPIFSEGVIKFFTDAESEMEWRKHFEELKAQGFLKSSTIDPLLVPVSVVGNRFSQDGGALNTVIDILSKEEIPVSIGVASALAITVAVPRTKAEDAVKVLHRQLVEIGER